HAREQLTVRLRDLGHGTTAAPLVVRASALPSQVGEVCAIVEQAARSLAAPAEVVARAGNGVVWSFWPCDDAATIDELVRGLRSQLRALHATLVVERCPSAAKAGLDVWGLEGDDARLMLCVKQAFDPAGLLAPGRML